MRIRFGCGAKSYEIVKFMLSRAFPNRGDLVVIDLTYGRGRFYRLVRRRIRTLIGVDVVEHEWEVEPDAFYRMPAQEFVEKVLEGEIEVTRPDLVVCDPPWSHEKRGAPARGLGIYCMPYHVRASDSRAIMSASSLLARWCGSPLLYRYKERLPYKHVVEVEAEVRIMMNRGTVYYGICWCS